MLNLSFKMPVYRYILDFRMYNIVIR